jgi:hypothetical protein
MVVFLSTVSVAGVRFVQIFNVNARMFTTACEPSPSAD